jgi:putative membrane protein
MRSLGIPALLAAALLACDRAADRPVNDGETAPPVETTEQVTQLLAPTRAAALVVVEHADMGTQRATRPDVRQYAQTVAADHRALIAVLDSTARARTAVLQENEPARELSHTVRMAHAGLDALGEAEFDMAFIRSQVESHRQLVDMLDTEATPSATSAEMRTLLEDTRAMVYAHLTRARQLLGTLLGEPVEPPPSEAVRTPTRPRPLGTPVPPGG